MLHLFLATSDALDCVQSAVLGRTFNSMANMEKQFTCLPALPANPAGPTKLGPMFARNGASSFGQTRSNSSSINKVENPLAIKV